MFVDVVRPGEDLAAVARRHGVTPEAIIELNGLPGPGVTAGQALLIPSNRYVVQPGDSLFRIAERSGVTLAALRRANPRAGEQLSVGQVLRIPPPPRYRGEVIGYLPVLEPGVTGADIARWGPNLTYVAIFAYRVDASGNLTAPDDTEAIRATYAAGAQPLMSVANVEPTGRFSPAIARGFITQPQARERLIQGILRTLDQKGYAGVDMDIENIDRSERAGYVDFLRELKGRLGGRLLNVAVAPKWDEETFAYARGHDYAGIGEVADRVYLMNYEFHWVGGPPGAIGPFNLVRRVLLYAASLIPRGKILAGMPAYGYEWPLPDTPESRARTLSQAEAVNLAVRQGVPIRFSEPDREAWFRYRADGQEREVWTPDARSYIAKLALVRDLGLAGTGMWHLGFSAPQLVTLLSRMLQVVKR
ncbi:MAG: LysM peptidoglycan-binding domain-containing protein [Firmicutes bacterium]|nr:LysM peptidoglycan-binding domain-containing protein [Bacillota bacterium]